MYRVRQLVLGGAIMGMHAMNAMLPKAPPQLPAAAVDLREQGVGGWDSVSEYGK